MMQNCILALILLVAAPLFAQTNIYPLDSAYTRPWELRDRIDEIAAMKPDIVSVDTLGYSGTQHLPILALRISDDAQHDDPTEPAMLFCGPHQGEEVLGLEIVLETARRLVSAYGEDSEITRMIDASEIWLVPAVCVEGWAWTAGGYYPLKRKNDTDSNMNGLFEIVTDGVDINKNYPIGWYGDENENPASDYYKGPWPISEAETSAMVSFCDRERPAQAIFYHSSASGAFCERIFFPWHYPNRISPDWRWLRSKALRLAEKLPRDYEEGRYLVHTGYNNPRGYARNWFYAVNRTHALTIEVGGNALGFAEVGPGVIHPPNEQLARILDKHWDAALESLRMLRERLVSIEVVDPRGKPLTGVTVRLPRWDDDPDLLTVRTDASGRVWRYLPRGFWRIEVDDQLFWLDARQSHALFRIIPNPSIDLSEAR